jgi:hypothetical protein
LWRFGWNEELADDVARDCEPVLVLALWEGRPDVPVT